MLCTLQVHALECVQFEGLSAPFMGRYPFWFVELIEQGYLAQEYPDVYIYEGEHVVNEGDFFLLNQFGEVRYVSQQQFNEMFHVVI